MSSLGTVLEYIHTATQILQPRIFIYKMCYMNHLSKCNMLIPPTNSDILRPILPSFKLLLDHVLHAITAVVFQAIG